MTAVSVIVPTFNRAHWLPHAIQSVLHQRYRDFELIVVDDGSTDDTPQILQSFGSALTWVTQANAGAASARNRGITMAQGTWLAFIDSDDEWHPDYLGTQMDHLQRDPSLQMQVTDCRLVGHGAGPSTYFALNGTLKALAAKRLTDPLCEAADQARFCLERPFSFIVEHPPWQVGATVMRRDAVLRSGMFNTALSLSEDVDLMARMALQGPMALICEALVDVHRRPGDLWSLSDAAQLGPVRSLMANERVYSQLLHHHALNAAERCVMKRVCGQNRRALAHQLALQGQIQRARLWYLRSLWRAPSWPALAATVAACLPAPVHRTLLRWARQWRQRAPAESTS